VLGKGGGDSGHAQERRCSFLHPRAARSGDAEERQPLDRGTFDSGRDA
jgi:hypothetical protein